MTLAELGIGVLGAVAAKYEGALLNARKGIQYDKVFKTLDVALNLSMSGVALVHILGDMGILGDFVGGYIAIKSLKFAERKLIDDPMRSAISAPIDDGGEIALYDRSRMVVMSATDPVNIAFFK